MTPAAGSVSWSDQLKAEYSAIARRYGLKEKSHAPEERLLFRASRDLGPLEVVEMWAYEGRDNNDWGGMNLILSRGEDEVLAILSGWKDAAKLEKALGLTVAFGCAIQELLESGE